MNFNYKMTFSFTIVSTIVMTTLKFVNRVRAKILGNGVLEFKNGALSIFGLKYNFYVALW